MDCLDRFRRYPISSFLLRFLLREIFRDSEMRSSSCRVALHSSMEPCQAFHLNDLKLLVELMDSTQAKLKGLKGVGWNDFKTTNRLKLTIRLDSCVDVSR